MRGREDALSELDVMGALLGTDKCSAFESSWDYLQHYEELFSKWKNNDINLIEIGVESGASLKLWNWYFEKATIVGVDINPDCRRFAEGRVNIKIGSQEDPSFLQEIANSYPPTVVIDDGSHIAHHMITSFETLFPRLLPGGIYILEDLAFHFEDGGGQWQGFKAHQGLSDTHIYEYLGRFIRARAANLKTPKTSWGFSRYAFEHIDSVLTFGSAIAIRKTAARDHARDVEVFERELKQHGTGLIRERYAHYLVRHDVYRDRAVELLTEVLRSNTNNISALADLFHVLDRLSRFDEAAEAVAAILRVDPSITWAWHGFAEIQRKRKRSDLELQALERLVEITQASHDVYWRLSQLHENAGNVPAALIAARKASEINPNNSEFARRVTSLEARS